MKKYLFFISMALVALTFSSCNGKKGVFTPTSSGRAYEILVVVDHALWERPAGRALFDVLDTDVRACRSLNVHSGLCILLRETMILH